MRGHIITILILAVLLLVAAGYIGYTLYNNAKLNEQVTIYQQGAQAGYTQAIGQLYTEAVKCDLRNGVPVTIQNQTIHVVSLECIQASQKPAQ